MTPIVSAADLEATADGLCHKLAKPDLDSHIGPNLWYPDGLDWATGAAQEAIQVCRICPARLACLQIAVRDNQAHGIWGGFNMGDPVEKQRAVKLTGITPRSRHAECGTNAGYLYHLKSGEQTCDQCRRAHAAAKRRRESGAA